MPLSTIKRNRLDAAVARMLLIAFMARRFPPLQRLARLFRPRRTIRRRRRLPQMVKVIASEEWTRTLLLSLVALLPAVAVGAESICYGTPSNGRLEHGVQLPASGSNFEPYSSVGVSLGRTYVHSRVAHVVADAYSSLTRSAPGVRFVYGESGWKRGGRIRPHRTHQNGLAVDFMVPVRDAKRRSVALPSTMTNKFGYSIEFDSAGRFEDLTIDFEAIAEHLYALHHAAKAEGIGIKRVIFDPPFIPRLYKTKRGEFIRANLNFMKGQAWVRHDEHYHVDFSVPCQPLRK